jgi:hypothetical protein
VRGVLAQIAYGVGLSRPSGTSSWIATPRPISECLRAPYLWDLNSSRISALIIVPQIIVALMAPRVGRQAQDWGRRPLLLIGFAALPIRALGFALIGDPLLLLAVQALDGISATVLGVLTALVIADLTGVQDVSTWRRALLGQHPALGPPSARRYQDWLPRGLARARRFCVSPPPRCSGHS